MAPAGLEQGSKLKRDGRKWPQLICSSIRVTLVSVSQYGPQPRSSHAALGAAQTGLQRQALPQRARCPGLCRDAPGAEADQQDRGRKITGSPARFYTISSGLSRSPSPAGLTQLVKAGLLEERVLNLQTPPSTGKMVRCLDPRKLLHDLQTGPGRHRDKGRPARNGRPNTKRAKITAGLCQPGQVHCPRVTEPGALDRALEPALVSATSISQAPSPTPQLTTALQLSKATQ